MVFRNRQGNRNSSSRRRIPSNSQDAQNTEQGEEQQNTILSDLEDLSTSRRIEDILSQFLDGSLDLPAFTETARQTPRSRREPNRNPMENTSENEALISGEQQVPRRSSSLRSNYLQASCGNSAKNLIEHKKHIVDNSQLVFLKSIYSARIFDQIQFPTTLDSKQCCPVLELNKDKLTVVFKGDKNTPNESGSIRSNFNIKPSVGVYYFEVEIINKGQQGVIAIGLSVFSCNLKSLPGWDLNSYGYHGDDGKLYIGSGQGSEYGFTYTSGDTIGCCVNFIDNLCFFTKNGVNSGIAFNEVPYRLHPTIGMRDAKTSMRVNFGQRPFLFKIADYFEVIRNKHIFNSSRFSADNGFLDEQSKKFILSYLIHHGHYETATMFSSATNQECDLSSIQLRNNIMKNIIQGKVGQAVKFIENSFPNLLNKSPKLLFLLRIQQFIEKVLKNDNDAVSPSDFLYKVIEVNSKETDLQEIDEETFEIECEESNPLFKINYESNNEEEYESMEISNSKKHSEMNNLNDDINQSKNALNFPNTVHIESSSFNNISANDGQLFSLDQSSLENIKEVLIFGHLLYQAGVYLFNHGLIDSLHYHSMMEVFSLIVVDDIQSSTVSHLISHSRREALADRVNSSLLQQMGYPGLSNVDSLKNQTEICYNTMADLHIPITGALDISKFC